MGNGNSNERNRGRNNANRNTQSNQPATPRNPVPYSPNTQVLPPPPSGYPPPYPGTLPYNQPMQHNYPRPPYPYPAIPPPQGPPSLQPYGTWIYPMGGNNRNIYPYPPPEYHRPVLTDSQNTITIKNEVNVNRSSLRLLRDPSSPEKVLVSFTLDSTATGSITILLMSKEGESFSFHPAFPSIHPCTMEFEKGVAQKIQQSSNSGFDLSPFSPQQLSGYGGITPLVIRTLSFHEEDSSEEKTKEVRELGLDPTSPLPRYVQSQVTLASIIPQKDGDYQVKVLKQKIWFDGNSYELQEIYGIESSASDSPKAGGEVGDDDDLEDNGKMCVICLSEPRSTTVLPCRHMCMCKECANVLRTQSSKCPICRQPVDSLLEIRVPKGEKQNFQII